ncbi:LpqB family beta-propeller domain-containing protein [Ruania halotolerans]|uniref:LpqB family beta-propeller domain-containing protein n=1 Tax=Ruania halotolerans TaxID=2897773 RepID=UPI001E332F2D|nr:LpqB family beta-propeller domain-containing protein [Ruania halotolerans]UFU07589.1 LpqB family beta-propeller domain-containing protein [Ruania halotolerans]
MTRWSRTAWATVVSAAVLAGCASLPTSGPVQPGVEADPDQGVGYVVGEDPTPGDPPDSIVRGFQSAAVVGTTDDFVQARKFLTASTAGTWASADQVIVYDASVQLRYAEPTEGVVEVTAAVAATVNAVGVYTQAAPGSTTTLTYELEQEDGEWRIESLPEGVLISEVNFSTLYRQTPLYYLSSDASALVPDPRWFPQRNAATYAIRGLLAGVAEWMSPAVVSAIPAGTGLTIDSVTVSGGVASVPLTREAQSASAADRALLLAQITETLVRLPQVQSVSVTVDGVPLEQPQERPELTVDPLVGRSPMMISADEELVSFNGAQLTPVPDVAPLVGLDAAHVALPYDDAPPVVLSGTNQLVALPSSAEPEPLHTGPDLLPPSYGPDGWVWTGAQENDGELMVVRPSEQQTRATVAAEALAGLQVRVIRVSRDGTRLATVVQDGDTTRALVFSVVTGTGGVPTALGESLTIARGIEDVTDLVWLDGSTLAVLGTTQQTERVHLVPLGGPITRLPSVPGTREVAAGNGERELFLTTDEGVLYGRSGNGWAELASGVQYPAFAG